MKEKLLEDIKNWENIKSKYNEHLISKLKGFSKVILYGPSESAVVAIDFFKKNNIVVDEIYNDFAQNDNEYFYGVKVTKPKIDNLEKNAAIIVTISYFDEIKERLEKFDSEIANRLFVFDGYFVTDVNLKKFTDNIDKIVDNYNSLADEKSKSLYLTLLKYRYVRDTNMLKNLIEPRKDCYFDNVFLDNFKDGLYLDIGSYNADFVTDLATLKDVTNSKFYIYEPNKIFCAAIDKNISKDINYQLFPIALCDVTKEMSFQQTNSSTSHLLESNYNAYQNYLDSTLDIVKTDTVDNIIKEPVAGIKVDIEGSEEAMIKGATKTIQRDRPIILLSIYHRASDLWELQNYIKSLNLNYKFYIRHYSLSCAKTILYCIPDTI